MKDGTHLSPFQGQSVTYERRYTLSSPLQGQTVHVKDGTHYWGPLRGQSATHERRYTSRPPSRTVRDPRKTVHSIEAPFKDCQWHMKDGTHYRGPLQRQSVTYERRYTLSEPPSRTVSDLWKTVHIIEALSRTASCPWKTVNIIETTFKGSQWLMKDGTLYRGQSVTYERRHTLSRPPSRTVSDLWETVHIM
jgi:hypothetical protein